MRIALLATLTGMLGLTTACTTAGDAQPDQPISTPSMATVNIEQSAEQPDPVAELEKAAEVHALGTDENLTPESFTLEEDDPAAGIDPDSTDKAVVAQGEEGSAAAEIVPDSALPVQTNPEPKAAQKNKADSQSAPIRVYFVKSREAVIRENPDESAKAVKTLIQGDSVMVSVQGDWGRITAKQWVPLDALSQLPVGRSRSNTADSSWLPGKGAQ